MKKFVELHVLILLLIYGTLLVALVFTFVRWGNFKDIKRGGISLLEPEVSNEYSLKPINTVKYGFLPYWSVADFNDNLQDLTDIAYFSLFFDKNGYIDKANNHYTTWQSSIRLNQIIRDAKNEGVRLSITVAIHENEAIEEFLSCGEPCFNRSFNEVVEEIDSSGFRGINFDFEYVGLIMPSELSTQYADYIKYMSKNLKDRYGDDFIVVVSTFGDSVKRNRITNISELNDPLVDYLFIMAYDYFRPNSSKAGPVAPLTGAGEMYDYDVSSAVKDYLRYIDSTRLILGIPTYGINYIVEEPTPYSPRIPGNDYIQYSIQQNLSAIDTLINREDAKVEWDNVSSTPYFTYYKSNEGVYRLVFFENEKSINLKQEFAKNNGMAGYGYWALGYTSNGISE